MLVCLLLDRVSAQMPCVSVALFYLSLRRFVCSILNSVHRAPSILSAPYYGFQIRYLRRLDDGSPLSEAMRRLDAIRTNPGKYFVRDASTGKPAGTDVND